MSLDEIYESTDIRTHILVESYDGTTTHCFQDASRRQRSIF